MSPKGKKGTKRDAEEKASGDEARPAKSDKKGDKQDGEAMDRKEVRLSLSRQCQKASKTNLQELGVLLRISCPSWRNS